MEYINELFLLLEEMEFIIRRGDNPAIKYKDYERVVKFKSLGDRTAFFIWGKNRRTDYLQRMDDDLVVKDYVKSRKHEWYDACYIPKSKDITNAKKIITNFVERQGEMLVGGIVLREYLKLKSIGYHKQSGMPIAEDYYKTIRELHGI